MSFSPVLTQHEKYVLFFLIFMLRQNTGENDSFQHKKCIKTQNFKTSKININHLQDLKKVRKAIFNGSMTNLVQNRILKKNSEICSKILKIPDFLNFPKSQNGQNWAIIIQLCSKVFPKLFLCSKPKNSWKYSKKLIPPQRAIFFLGGG